VISTAIKKGTAKQHWIDAAVRSMTTLNRTAAEVISSGRVGVRPAQAERRSSADGGSSESDNHFSVHAMTDVTGFGLIGHAREIALASKVSLLITASRIPVLEGALECIREGNIPGGLKANREFSECLVGYNEGLTEELKTLLFDPQTAGGLLISVAPEHAKELSQAIEIAGVPVNEIGEVLPSGKPVISVTA